MKRVIQVSERLREQSGILLVIGVGGSYLGAQAALSILDVNPLKKKTKK